MSVLWVRRDEAAAGRLPARCARTGERCITRFRHPVSDLSAPVEWATWTGLWPRPRRDAGPGVVLPLLPDRHRAVRRLRHLRDASAALVLTGVVLVAVTGSGLPGRLAGSLAIAAVLVHVATAVVGWATTVEIRVDRTGEWVRLGGVHPDFVAAAERSTTRPDRDPVLVEDAVRTRVRRPASGEALES